MTSVAFLPRAAEEMNEAARFYEERAAGLGADFLDEIERVVQSIAERPDMGRQLGNDTLRRITRRFPFGVLYKRESAARIVIVAVCHLRRRPNYWRDRL